MRVFIIALLAAISYAQTGRCSWSDPITGSIGGANIECHNGISLSDCKQLCEDEPSCQSLDFQISDGDACCLGNCRIGDGQCSNDNDQEFQYYECVEDSDSENINSPYFTKDSTGKCYSGSELTEEQCENADGYGSSWGGADTSRLPESCGCYIDPWDGRRYFNRLTGACDNPDAGEELICLRTQLINDATIGENAGKSECLFLHLANTDNLDNPAGFYYFEIYDLVDCDSPTLFNHRIHFNEANDERGADYCIYLDAWVGDWNRNSELMIRMVYRTLDDTYLEDEFLYCPFGGNCCSGAPTSSPTAAPSTSPTQDPTTSPTDVPSKDPSSSPTSSPTDPPSASPSNQPSSSPTSQPTRAPTNSPSACPSRHPSTSPTSSPSYSPSLEPSPSPTESPSPGPSTQPSKSPHSSAPSANPTKQPSKSPSEKPSRSPSKQPTPSPTQAPSTSPTTDPTHSPTTDPTSTPTEKPSAEPSATPSLSPTISVETRLSLLEEMMSSVNRQLSDLTTRVGEAESNVEHIDDGLTTISTCGAGYEPIDKAEDDDEDAALTERCAAISNPCECIGDCGWSTENDICGSGSEYRTTCTECDTLEDCITGSCLTLSDEICPVEYNEMRICQCNEQCRDFGNCCWDVTGCGGDNYERIGVNLKCNVGDSRTFKLDFTSVENCARRCAADDNCDHFATDLHQLCIGCSGMPTDEGIGFHTYRVTTGRRRLSLENEVIELRKLTEKLMKMNQELQEDLVKSQMR